MFVFCFFLSVFCITCSHDIVGAIYNNNYLSPCLRILCIIFIVDLQFMAIKDFADHDIKGKRIDQIFTIICYKCMHNNHVCYELQTIMYDNDIIIYILLGNRESVSISRKLS